MKNKNFLPTLISVVVDDASPFEIFVEVRNDD
jgi:hypothetical protein